MCTGFLKIKESCKKSVGKEIDGCIQNAKNTYIQTQLKIK